MNENKGNFRIDLEQQLSDQIKQTQQKIEDKFIEVKKQVQWTPKDQEKLFNLSKFLFICGGIGLIISSAVRFVFVDSSSVHEMILNGYYLFLGVIVGLSQLNVKKITMNFRFLNYHWGKFLFSLFLATMSFGSGSKDANIQWTNYIVTLYFFLLSIVFAILAGVDGQRDEIQYKIDKIDILQNSPLFRV